MRNVIRGIVSAGIVTAVLVGLLGGCGRRGELVGTIGARSDAASPDGNASPSPRFTLPRIVDAVSDPIAKDADPTVTGDLLELFFMSDRSGTPDIWTSKRASATDPWGPPTFVAELSSPLDDSGPAVSLDGLRIWLTSSRDFSMGKIWHASRPTRTGAWTLPVVVLELDAPAAKDFSPAVDATETTMMFASNRAGSFAFDVYASTRTTAAAPWGVPRLVPGANGFFDDWDPFVAQGGLVIFLTSMRQGAGDIFWSARQSTTAPFPEPLALDDINSPVWYDSDPCLSLDLTYMLFDSNRTGGSDIYEAHAIP